MSDDLPRLEAFLNVLERERRHSPKSWHQFYVFLRSKQRIGQEDPPVPFILAASGESAASKLRCLGAQLRWAMASGCFEDAIQYLQRIPAEQWDSCSAQEWYSENYPTIGPTYSVWNSTPRPRVSAESAARAIEILRASWDRIAGPELSRVTSPIRLTGAKRRRLVVFAQRDATPPWGTWSTLEGKNWRSFTEFRSSVNAAISPIEVDHIDFVHETTEPSA